MPPLSCAARFFNSGVQTLRLSVPYCIIIVTTHHWIYLFHFYCLDEEVSASVVLNCQSCYISSSCRPSDGLLP